MAFAPALAAASSRAAPQMGASSEPPGAHHSSARAGPVQCRHVSHRPDDPAGRIAMLRVSHDYSPTRGLTAEQARGLPALMLRNGLRAAEVVGLRAGDLGEDQAFRVATIRGKGGKLRSAKLAGAT